MTNMLKNNLVWDAHAGLFPSPEMDLNILEDWRKDGVNYLSVNVGFDVMSRDETLATLAAYRRWLLANSDRFLLAGKFADIDQAKLSGRLAVSFDIEGMNALGGDIKWEVSRGGAEFPHLYRRLQLDDVVWCLPLPLIDGRHKFPDQMT